MNGKSSSSALALAVVLVVACGHRGITPIRTHFNKGVYLYSQGNYDGAVGEYRMALDEDPGDHRARFNLAETLEVKATLLESADALDEAEKLRSEAEEHYRAILAQRPDDLRASVNLAAREMAQGDVDAAETRLHAAMERHPRSPLPRVALAAHRLRQAGDDPDTIADAVELLEEALGRDRRNVDANMLLGHAYAALDEPDEAREAYLRALEHAPSDVATLMALAHLEAQAGHPQQSESWLRRALYVRPDQLEAHLLLSEALDAQGNLEGATFHLWRSRQLEDERWPRLSPEEYDRRLLDLYRRLTEHLTASGQNEGGRR